MKHNPHSHDMAPHALSRRSFLNRGLQLTGMAATGVLPALFSNAAQAAEPIRFVGWGGTYQDAQKLAYQQPYTKKTGIGFTNIEKASSAAAIISTQEQSGNVYWDLVIMIQAPAERLAQEGGLEKFDYDTFLPASPNGTAASQDMVPGSIPGKQGYFIPTDSYSTVLVYNTDTFPGDSGPKSIKDIFDLKKYPGTRVLQKNAFGNLEWALYADGVPLTKIYEELKTKAGVDHAFKKLDSIKGHVQWWTEGAQPPQMLAQHVAVMATAYNGRAFNSIADDHQPLNIVWDGSIYEWEGFVVPKGIKPERLKVIHDFIKYATDPKTQAELCKYIPYAPSRQSAIQYVSTYHKDPSLKMIDFLPTSPEHLKVSLARNVEFWINYGDELQDRFNSWLLR